MCGWLVEGMGDWEGKKGGGGLMMWVSGWGWRRSEKAWFAVFGQ